MKKRVLSILLTLAMLLTLIPVMSFATSAIEHVEFSEVIAFNESVKAESEHFTLSTVGGDSYGWHTGRNASITIKAKSDDVIISAINAVVSYHGEYYSRVIYSSGKKVETGNVETGSTVHVTDIYAKRLEIFGPDPEGVEFKDITVYYREVKTETIDNESWGSDHFAVSAVGKGSAGWYTGFNGTIKIKAKSDDIMITAVKAVVGYHGEYYSRVSYSNGNKVESGNVETGSTVNVTDINANRLEIFGPNPEGVQFKDFTVYYTYVHDFTGMARDNGDGTHTLKCTGCDAYSPDAIAHSYRPVKKVSDDPLTYTARCTGCPNEITNFPIPGRPYIDTDRIAYKNVGEGDILKGGTLLQATYWAGDADMIVYIDGKKVFTVSGGKLWMLPQCVKCLDYDSHIGTSDPLEIWFESICDYTFATCENPETCVYCGNTVGEKAPHNFENGACTVCGMHPFEFGSFNLVLSGELGMNFTGIVNDMETVKDGYMLFEIGKTGEQKVYLSDLTAEEDGTYIFRCNINVLQMADTITVSFHYGDEVVGPHTTSVAQYLKNIVAKNSDNEELVDLAHAIENYGHYAQIALQEVHGFTLGENGKYQTMAGYNDIVLPDAAELADYKATKTGGIAQISKLSRALALDHGTDILLYFNCADGYTPDIAVTDKDGNAVACPLTKDESGRYILTIPSISAHKLGDFYTVSFDNDTMTIDICALSYAYSILNNSASSTNQKNAVAALYAYYQAAIAYQAAHE